MPFPKISSKPGVLPEKVISAVPFNQMQCPADTHRGREVGKEMHMILHDFQLKDSHAVSHCCIFEDCVAILLHFEEFEAVPSILGFPHKVIAVLSYAMPKILDLHVLSSERFLAWRSTCYLNLMGECAGYATHLFFKLLQRKSFSVYNPA